MFEDVTINLSGPTCNCEQQDLGWNIWSDGDEPGLQINCHICKTKVLVPFKKFVAWFTLKTPYPKEEIDKALKPEISKTDVDFLKDSGISPDTKTD